VIPSGAWDLMDRWAELDALAGHSTFHVKRGLQSTLYISAEGSSAEMQRSSRCREQQVLYGRLRTDTKVYSEATRRLDSCKPEDFDKTYQAAESARMAFLKAREVLAAHIIEHQCER
jgi:hypothetical protein